MLKQYVVYVVGRDADSVGFLADSDSFATTSIYWKARKFVDKDLDPISDALVHIGCQFHWFEY